jgi:DNA-binding NtrC family response regulator
MAHILVTDDDATTRQMISGVLKKKGYKVSTASDGLSALRAIQKNKFDLVLLDIWMPKLTGLGLLGKLQTEKAIPKIIVMTTDKTSETVLTALRGRVYQFLTKPLEADSLLLTVDSALSAEPSAPPIEIISGK